MSQHHPILACGNMGLTGGEAALLLALAVGWLVAGILCLVNLIMIFRVSRSPVVRLRHFLIFMVYIGLTAFLFCLQKVITNDDWASQIGRTLVMAIPLLVIGHFVYLLICRRRFKRAAGQAIRPSI